MASPATHMLRSRWFALTVHVALWLLLFLVLKQLGGKPPEYKERTAFTVPPEIPVPVNKFKAVFAADHWPAKPLGAGESNPFFTRQFVPPPTPPAPPPPTTRKIEATYLGFYQTAEQPRCVIVKLADAFVMAPIGTSVATNVFVAEATFSTLTLTNLAAQTNLLPVNVKKEIEVPIK